MAKMKALLMSGPHNMELIEREIPRPAPNQVLLKIRAAGICGTDVHFLNGKAPAGFPVIPGHEVSGEVMELGSDVNHLQLGNRVTIDPNVYCGHCSFCRNGDIHLCENNRCFGIYSDGGFAEYAVISANFAYKLPDSMTWLEGSMIEPAACCMHGAEMAEYKMGDTVLIHGAGAIGNMHVQYAKLNGAATIIVSEPIASRRELALQMGADYAIDPLSQDVYAEVCKILPERPRVIIDCSGRPQVIEQAIPQVRWGGRIVMFGVCPSDVNISINPAYINDREITLCGSYDYLNSHKPSIESIASGRLKIKQLISHVFSLEDYEKAFATFGAKDSMKIVIAPNGIPED